MEMTGLPGRIHISSSTAEELRTTGLGKWITARTEKVTVKGKGEMQTFWLETKRETLQKAKALKHDRPSIGEEFAPDVIQEDDDDNEAENLVPEQTQLLAMDKTQRLVEWNVEILSFLLQQIVAARGTVPNKTTSSADHLLEAVENEIMENTTGTVLDEFKEIIELPVIHAKELLTRKDPKSVQLDVEVVSQLRNFLSHVATMYRPNPFHNFEHASHVTASVRKLLTRIVNANTASACAGQNNNTNTPLFLVDNAGTSFGITSDPLTQFAVVFSAQIHDADHPGVPNGQLVQENTRHAQIYQKSIAEQNSVDLVWALLMSPDFKALRGCIYSNEQELRRFRQLVVNTVMATDIVDKELQTLRKERWARAFSEESKVEGDGSLTTSKEQGGKNDDMNRKATIVIEHLIQASDVSHTMQHWHIYKQWNERFFFELYGAYKAGRATTDPSIGWYQGEIGFFDFYIIPLAKKLESCGCFGVSSHEYLNYAKANREEWVREGEGMVQEYLRKYHNDDQHEAEA
jgi:hypothetical protein